MQSVFLHKAQCNVSLHDTAEKSFYPDDHALNFLWFEGHFHQCFQVISRGIYSMFSPLSWPIAMLLILNLTSIGFSVLLFIFAGCAVFKLIKTIMWAVYKEKAVQIAVTTHAFFLQIM